MGDELDNCECVWSHEFAMQRLLAFIRSTQQQCTDTECIDDSHRLIPLSETHGSTESNSYSSFFSILMIVAIIMMFMGPDSILKLTKSRNKRDPGADAPPPPPPPPVVN